MSITPKGITNKVRGFAERANSLKIINEDVSKILKTNIIKN